MKSYGKCYQTKASDEQYVVYMKITLWRRLNRLSGVPLNELPVIKL